MLPFRFSKVFQVVLKERSNIPHEDRNFKGNIRNTHKRTEETSKRKHFCCKVKKPSKRGIVKQDSFAKIPMLSKETLTYKRD